ncbi:unnamed protein product [Arabidopsis halleri]
MAESKFQQQNNIFKIRQARINALETLVSGMGVELRHLEELGAAKSKDVRDLVELLVSLKDTIARKDKEIERLHQVYDIQHHQTRVMLLIGYGNEEEERIQEETST